ncbi:hypothetical protein ACLOJK_009717 [Asimina triloba]
MESASSTWGKNSSTLVGKNRQPTKTIVTAAAMGNMPNQQPPPSSSSIPAIKPIIVASLLLHCRQKNHCRSSSFVSADESRLTVDRNPSSPHCPDRIYTTHGSRREPISIITAAAMVALVRNRPINNRTRPSNQICCR